MTDALTVDEREELLDLRVERIELLMLIARAKSEGSKVLSIEAAEMALERDPELS